MNLLPPNRRRNFLPGGMPRIDWTNPLTAGLFACYVPCSTGGTKIPNLTGMGIDLVTNSAPGWKNLSEGQYLASTAQNQGARNSTIPDNLKFDQQLTCFWRGNRTALNGGNSVGLMGIFYDTAFSSPNWLFNLCANQGGGNAIANRWNVGGVAATSGLVDSSVNFPPLNTTLSIAGSIKTGGSSYIYVDGKLRDTAAVSAGSITYTSSSMVALGCHPTTTLIGNLNTACGMMWNRQLTHAEVASISQDPYQFLIYPEDDIFDLMLRNLYSMIPDTGSYTVTGKNATLAAQRKIAPAQGTYALTGVAAILAAQRKIAPAAGSYTLTGVSALLAAQRRITPSAGSYVLSGQAAVLAAGRKIAPAAGSYILTGNAAALVAARKAYPSAGAYVLSGQNAQLTRGAKIIPSSGSYALSGMSAILAVGHKIAPAAGVYNLTGEAAILAAARRINPGAGVYALSGQDAILKIGRNLIPATGAYLIEGMSADLFITTGGLHPLPGTYGVTGFDVTFTVRRTKSKIILISGFLNDAEIEAVLRS